MGATNAMAEFQACMTFILQAEIPDLVTVFVDDCAVKGPKTHYELGDSYEVLDANPGIRRFIWEHAQDVHRVLHRIRHAGATVSAPKLQLAVSECTCSGVYARTMDEFPTNRRFLRYATGLSVKPSRTFAPSLVHAGSFMHGFEDTQQSLDRSPSCSRTATDGNGDRSSASMERLKDLVADAPCLAPLDFKTESETILAVDSSNIASVLFSTRSMVRISEGPFVSAP
ncbi:hypothetical protein OPQ81_001143 [Rhizoctonia solani]|nr:hypothetical protein OPQ81_001143 [Rhizoctonia solani]